MNSSRPGARGKAGRVLCRAGKPMDLHCAAWRAAAVQGYAMGDH